MQPTQALQGAPRMVTGVARPLAGAYLIA